MELNPAQQLAARRYHCAESVLMAVCRELGVENALVPRIATAFGGGMGHSGEACGAVTGAVMAIGVKLGREQPEQSCDEPYAVARRFVQGFREQMGSIYCRDLTGMDLSTPEGLKQYLASDVPVRVCLPAIGFAYQRTLDLLGLPQSEAGV